jgi:hypothetical protein
MKPQPIPGQTVKVCGRPAVVVAVYKHCVRVRYTEPTERSKLLGRLFIPFEANVPHDHLTW